MLWKYLIEQETSLGCFQQKEPCSEIKTTILDSHTVLFLIITFIASGFLVRFSEITGLHLHKTPCFVPEPRGPLNCFYKVCNDLLIVKSQGAWRTFSPELTKQVWSLWATPFQSNFSSWLLWSHSLLGFLLLFWHCFHLLYDSSLSVRL